MKTLVKKSLFAILMTWSATACMARSALSDLKLQAGDDAVAASQRIKPVQSSDKTPDAAVPRPDYAALTAKARSVLSKPGQYSLTEGLELANALFAVAMDGRFDASQQTEALDLGRNVFSRFRSSVEMPDYAALKAKAKSVLGDPGRCPPRQGFELANALFRVSMDGRFDADQQTEALDLGHKVSRLFRSR